VSAPRRKRRPKPRWFFLLAIVLGVLAITVLPTPFGGIAAMACVAAFFYACGLVLRDSDPEMVDHVTRGGIPGGGGGF
jgi:hypothetical protein